MRRFLAAIPQGMIWYPVILVIFVSAAATLWRLFRKGRRRRRPESGRVEHLESIAELIRRGQNDTMASQELERRTLSLLLRCNGYPGYSSAFCREYLEANPESIVADLVRSHLEDLHVEPGTRHIPYRNGLPVRVTSLIEYIEKELEV